MKPVNVSPSTSPEVYIQKEVLSREETIKLCREKYPQDFKRKKIYTLAIVISTLAFNLLSLVGLAFSCLTLASPLGIALLIATPLAIIGLAFLVKKIDDKYLYWSAKLAKKILELKEEEAKEIANQLPRATITSL
jgi:hypothetical protein